MRVYMLLGSRLLGWRSSGAYVCATSLEPFFFSTVSSPLIRRRYDVCAVRLSNPPGFLFFFSSHRCYLASLLRQSRCPAPRETNVTSGHSPCEHNRREAIIFKKFIENTHCRNWDRKIAWKLPTCCRAFERCLRGTTVDSRGSDPSRAVRATDSFPRGVTFFGNARMAPPTKEPSPDSTHKFCLFWRLVFQSATSEAVWSSVGTSPVSSSQKTASGLGAFPRRGKSLRTSGIVSPLFINAPIYRQEFYPMTRIDFRRFANQSADPSQPVVHIVHGDFTDNRGPVLRAKIPQ